MRIDNQFEKQFDQLVPLKTKPKEQSFVPVPSDSCSSSGGSSDDFENTTEMKSGQVPANQPFVDVLPQANVSDTKAASSTRPTPKPTPPNPHIPFYPQPAKPGDKPPPGGWVKPEPPFWEKPPFKPPVKPPVKPPNPPAPPKPNHPNGPPHAINPGQGNYIP